jgi:hypothetical protein
VLASGVVGAAALLVPTADWPPSPAATLVAARFPTGCGSTIYDANQVSAPRELLGRVTESHWFVARVTMPPGSLVGGLPVEALGARRRW